MSVALMLKEKGRNVITAKPDDTLEEITKLLAEKKIGAVLILDEQGKLAGIASERDIIRTLAHEGVGSFSKPISSCMTKKVVSCSQNDSLNGVMSMMNKGRFRHVPVIDDGELQGVISVTDVVTYKMAQVTREAEDLKRYISDGYGG